MHRNRIQGRRHLSSCIQPEMDPAFPHVQMRRKFGAVASFQGIHNLTVLQHIPRGLGAIEGGREI